MTKKQLYSQSRPLLLVYKTKCQLPVRNVSNKIGDDAILSAQTHVHPFLESLASLRLVRNTPKLESHESTAENSLMVRGHTRVLHHNYAGSNARQTSLRTTHIGARPNHSDCHLDWRSDTFLPQALPRLSNITGMLNVQIFKKPNPNKTIPNWHLPVVAFKNGKELWSRLVGAGTGNVLDPLSSVTAPVVLGPNSVAYAGIRNGESWQKIRLVTHIKSILKTGRRGDSIHLIDGDWRARFSANSLNNSGHYFCPKSLC